MLSHMTEENDDKTVRIYGMQVEIRRRYITNTSLEYTAAPAWY
jgi:hypothetical protein